MLDAPTVARFMVAGSFSPRLTEALPLAERVHLALVQLSNGSSVFTGCDSSHKPLKGHGHAHIFCESNDCLGRGARGEITHITVYAPVGFETLEENALQSMKEIIYRDSEPSVQLSLQGIGQPEDFGGTDPSKGHCPLLARSRCWISRTPFIPTRHPKVTRAGAIKRDDTGLQIGCPEHELRRLLKLGGFPEPVLVESVNGTWLGEQEVAWASFVCKRDNGEGKRAAYDRGYGFRIEFAEEIQGPLAVGYGSHFGMGSFLPDDTNNFSEAALHCENSQKMGDIQICAVEAKIKFLTQAHIPLWAGNGFRAGLGARLRNRICSVYISNDESLKEGNRSCKKDCQISRSCSYGRLFEPNHISDQKEHIFSSHAPPPLILKPPATGSYSPDDFAIVGFVAIGQAIDGLPYLFLALKDLGRSGLGMNWQIGEGRFDLKSAESLDPPEMHNVYQENYLQSRIKPFSYSDILSQSNELNGSIVMRFLTPTYVGDGKTHSSRPSFRNIISHLLFRANALSSLHGTGYLYNKKECQILRDVAEKVELVSAFVDKIYPIRKTDTQLDSDRHLPYFKGEITYRGFFSKDLVALLSLGQIIHVGWTAEIGNGMYSIDRCS